MSIFNRNVPGSSPSYHYIVQVAVLKSTLSRTVAAALPGQFDPCEARKGLVTTDRKIVVNGGISRLIQLIYLPMNRELERMEASMASARHRFKKCVIFGCKSEPRQPLGPLCIQCTVQRNVRLKDS